MRATFFDFGGVILSRPFEAFNAFEERNGLPRDFIRTINSTNPDTNAWARFERSEATFDEFCELFEAECREQGHVVTRSEEHTSELQSLMRISYAVFCLQKKKKKRIQ